MNFNFLNELCFVSSYTLIMIFLLCIELGQIRCFTLLTSLTVPYIAYLLVSPLSISSTTCCFYSGLSLALAATFHQVFI